jgi:L-alanine-DL-glutamate epimerase-like enolase superfamily enzyme
VERVWVRVEADGAEGWGEADPSPYYGETADTVVAALERLRPVIESTAEPEGLERLDTAIRSAAPTDGAARAALGAALHDLVGKRADLPLWKMWGLDPADAPLSSFTIGLADPEGLRTKVREAAAYPILKIKLGADRDEQVLRTIRDAAPDVTLRVDANAAWTAREAVGRIRMLRDYDVEFVEQPLPPQDREGYAFLHGRSALPIIVDESCVDSRDIPGLVGLADGINIKLAKCGGPREALRMVHAARACGLRVMMGCMLESTLGIAPAAHLAPLLDYADLDGAALLSADPFTGPRLDGPRIRLGSEPGLGVERA